MALTSFFFGLNQPKIKLGFCPWMVPLPSSSDSCIADRSAENHSSVDGICQILSVLLLMHLYA